MLSRDLGKDLTADERSLSMSHNSKIWRWRKLAVGLPIFFAVLFLIGCAPMEEKRDGFMAQGKKLYEQGDYIHARLQFKNAMQIDPKFA